MSGQFFVDGSGPNRVTPIAPAFGQRCPVDPAGVCSFTIGPANMAGQAGLWARALRQLGSHMSISIQIARAEGLHFPSDRVLEQGTTNQTVEEGLSRDVILSEGALWIDGRRLQLHSWLKVKNQIEKSGSQLAFVLHGSDVRLPKIHRELYRNSIFHDLSERRIEELNNRVQYTWEVCEFVGGNVFYTTLDLERYCPSSATWLPLTLSPEVIHLARSRQDKNDTWREKSEKIIIFHSPSSSEMKGSKELLSATEEYVNTGRFAKMCRAMISEKPTISREEYLRRLNTSDIFLDQYGIGGLGLAALEALALGKAVVTDCGPEAEDFYRNLHPDIPIFAIRESIPAALERAVSWCHHKRDRLVRGSEFPVYLETLLEIHDGARSANILLESFGRR